jgi:hypothetical protein
MVSVVMLSVSLQCHYAECHYAKSHCNECRYAKCHCAECRGARTKAQMIQVVNICQINRRISLIQNQIFEFGLLKQMFCPSWD